MKLLASAVVALSLAGNAVAQPQFGRFFNFGPPNVPTGRPAGPPGPPSRPSSTSKASTAATTTAATTTATTTTTVKSSTSTTSVSTTSTTTTTTSSGPSISVAVQSPAPSPGTCNTAADRSKWCGGYSVSTDAYSTWPTTGNICSYNFVLTNTTLSFDGVPKAVLAINGQVPGPTIECQWGDTVSITVTNSLTNNGTSIHWHGIRQLLTGYADGTPGITECPLAPGQTKTYTWVATQFGTTFYHSHYDVQNTDGIRGPIIIHGPASSNYDVDMGTVMVEDLFYQTGSQVYAEISHTGPKPADNYALNGKNTKVDLSTGAHALWQVTAGQKYLFRIVNSAAQNMWWMHFDSHSMTVIAMDNVPIVPYTTDWLAIAIGERYDVIVTADQPVGNYFFRAVSQSSCANVLSNSNSGLGSANGIIQYSGASTTLPTSTPGTSRTNFATCQDEPLASLVPFVPRSAGSQSAFSASTTNDPDSGARQQHIINQQRHHPSKRQYLGVLRDPNQFPTGHPMHLHGHDFAVLGQGTGQFSTSQASTLNFVSPARRDTVMLLGSGYTVIGFETDNPGAWLMHCHISWHIDGGLGLQYVEVPSQIPASQWVASNGFADQCSKYSAYEAAGAAKKNGGDSGLKMKRQYQDDSPVVRRSERKFLEAYKARRYDHL